ncbi:hypothetical protein J437_LFUL003115 [Ladona fulva]|uniref:Uncharacterized protein n=1 Tax=Ladona fulva TaxID=123851 RepID=A0A8K0JW27_LADFU|nr:hypothetical protein J437_LFUL003115 [Ladona fulva]
MDYCDIPSIRKTFYIFNFIFGVSGAALTIAGSIVTWRLSSSAASSFLPLAVLAPPAFIIALGLLSLLSLSLIPSLCAGSGNVTRSKKPELASGKRAKAVLYAAVVSAVAFAELITGSVSLSARKHYNRALREAMEESLYTYPNSSYARSQFFCRFSPFFCPEQPSRVTPECEGRHFWCSALVDIQNVFQQDLLKDQEVVFYWKANRINRFNRNYQQKYSVNNRGLREFFRNYLFHGCVYSHYFPTLQFRPLQRPTDS